MFANLLNREFEFENLKSMQFEIKINIALIFKIFVLTLQLKKSV